MSNLAARTPADFIANGYGLTCYCQRWPSSCRHWGDVTMEMITARLGAEFDIYSGRHVLLDRLVCSVCGARRPATILSRVSAAPVGPLPHPPMARDPVPIEEATRHWLDLSAAARAREAATGYDPPRGRRWRRFGRR